MCFSAVDCSCLAGVNLLVCILLWGWMPDSGVNRARIMFNVSNNSKENDGIESLEYDTHEYR
jgi:hypothetical protein